MHPLKLAAQALVLARDPLNPLGEGIAKLAATAGVDDSMIEGALEILHLEDERRRPRDLAISLAMSYLVTVQLERWS